MADNTTNKITYDLKNVHYALITEESESEVTYAAPKKLLGAVNFSFKKNMETTSVAADDDPEYATIIENKGYDGELELYGDIDDFLTDCMGMTKEGDTIVENKDDEPKHFALLCEFDGDIAERRHVFYRCIGKNPDVESSTRGDKVEAKSAKITITSSPAKDTGDIKRTVKKSDSDVYTKWFTQVITSGTVSPASQSATKTANTKATV